MSFFTLFIVSIFPAHLIFDGSSEDERAGVLGLLHLANQAISRVLYEMLKDEDLAGLEYGALGLFLSGKPVAGTC